LLKQEKKRDRQEEKKIEQWLSPLEFLKRQKDLINKCFPIGKLLLESEEFLNWAKGRPWHLRCYGVTGTGKVSYSSRVLARTNKVQRHIFPLS